MFDDNESLAQARQRNIQDALREDIGRGYWTAQLVPAGRPVLAQVRVREQAVLCGRDWFDGVFAASDMIAMRTLRALADRAVAVPDRVAVVGFDDLPLASQTVPRLTTVRQDIAPGAAAMVDTLFRRMAGADTPSTIMQPTLIVRDSA